MFSQRHGFFLAHLSRPQIFILVHGFQITSIGAFKACLRPYTRVYLHSHSRMAVSITRRAVLCFGDNRLPLRLLLGVSGKERAPEGRTDGSRVPCALPVWASSVRARAAAPPPARGPGNAQFPPRAREGRARADGTARGRARGAAVGAEGSARRAVGAERGARRDRYC